MMLGGALRELGQQARLRQAWVLHQGVQGCFSQDGWEGPEWRLQQWFRQEKTRPALGQGLQVGSGPHESLGTDWLWQLRQEMTLGGPLLTTA